MLGIDSAFHLPGAYQPPRLNLGKNPVALTFDHFAEPKLKADKNGVVEVGEKRYSLHRRRSLDRLSERGKAAAYLAFVPRLPDQPSELAIYRAEHRTNPHLPAKIYRKRNVLASDEPFSYAALYMNAELTISDRVHAVVLSLAFGNRAMLHNPITRRSALLDEVVDGSCSERPMRIRDGVIESHRVQVVQALRDAVS
jgi:hypothetical protein